MTTIAFKDGIMACDSAWSYEGIVTTLHTKICQFKSGGLLGQAGENDSRHVERLFCSVKSRAELPSVEKMNMLNIDFSGLLVLPDGSVSYVIINNNAISSGIFPADTRQFAAIGSGAHLAIGAMAAGATAAEAVAIAAEWDECSRLPVHEVSFKKKAKARS